MSVLFMFFMLPILSEMCRSKLFTTEFPLSIHVGPQQREELTKILCLLERSDTQGCSLQLLYSNIIQGYLGLGKVSTTKVILPLLPYKTDSHQISQSILTMTSHNLKEELLVCQECHKTKVGATAGSHKYRFCRETFVHALTNSSAFTE